MMCFNNKSYFLTWNGIFLTVSIVLILPQGSFQYPSSDPDCIGIGCDNPPSDAKCEIVPDSDTSIPQPTGPHANCCPLYRCRRSNDKPGDFFTFHGLHGTTRSLIGGSETISYGRGMKHVTSSATGDHNSHAIAGGDSLDVANALDEINKALGNLGLG